MKKGILILSVLICWMAGAFAQTTVTHDLTMWTTGQHTLWDGNSIRYYGFGPGFLAPPIFPAPILYAEEGDTVVVNVRNQSQRAPHTIHWHGLDVDQANDGVPNTSFVIYHLQDTHYTFIAPHPGTYLYHCHVASIIHVQMGMYGNVIVRPRGSGNEAWTGGPAFDQDKNWLISEFDKSWHDTIPEHDTTDSAYAFFRVPPYEPDYYLVNGRSRQDLSHASTAISAKVGEKVYLRLSNVGFYMDKITFPAHLQAEVISSDGRPLPSVWDQDTLWLMPGERYGVMLTPSIETDDSIQVSYVNMNTYQSWDVEQVPVSINGVIGIEPLETSGLSVSVFPNPNEGLFSVELTTVPPGNLELELTDLYGKAVHQEDWSSPAQGSLHKLDLQHLAQGIYLLSVRAGAEQFQTKISISR